MKKSHILMIKIFLITNFIFLMPLRMEAENSCLQNLKIGVSLPLTAGATSSGEAVRNSIILADEIYDTEGCVEFVFQDDQLLAKNTVTVVNQFINIERVNGLIIYGTPTSIAVGNIVEQNKIPMIALSILGGVVKDKEYIVKHWCTAEKLHQSIQREVKNRGYEKIAIVSTQNDAMLALRDLFVNEKHAEIVVNEEFVREETDFRWLISKVKAKKADAVYVLLFPPQMAIFMKQLRRQGFKGEAFGVHNVEDPAEVKVSDGSMMGMWLVNADDSVGEDYHLNYLKRFGKETSLGGASGYDSAKLFIEASNQTLEVNDFLHTVQNFKGAFGQYSATKNNDFNFGAVVKTVEADGFHVLHQ